MDNRVEKNMTSLRRAITNVKDRIEALEGEVSDRPSPAVRLVLERGLQYQRARLRSLEGELGRFEAAVAADPQTRIPGA